MGCHSLFWQIKSILSKVDVVSFDIFDTLLLRPYARPTDLFLHLEKLYNKPNFAIARMHAEEYAKDIIIQKVRQECPNTTTNKNEITFDSIYEYIEENFSDLKDKELELEFQTLQPNYEMLEIYKYIKALDKKIIITSDMYLPKDFIEKLLNKNGFTDYNHLYLSSDIGYTKASGLLYEYIKNDLAIEPSKILHIGDNYKTDIKTGKKYGFKTLFYQKIIEKYLQENKRDNILYNNFQQDLGASILIGLKSLHYHKKKLNIIKQNYWESIGYDYAGVIGYAYMQFVVQQAKKNNINNILFVARDGYTLQQIFDLMQTDIKTKYIYAPRFFNLIYNLQHKNDENKARAIIDFLASKYNDINNIKESNINNSALKIIEENKQAFENATKNELQLYIAYVQDILKQLNIDSSNLNNNINLGMVDTATIEFSAQNLLQESINYLTKNQTNKITIHANYWFYSGYKYSPRQMPICSIFSKNECLKIYYPQKWGFVEFLLTSPELPIKGIDSNYQPIYDNKPTSYELTRQKIYPYISNNALLFAQDIKNIFGDKNVFFSAELMVAYLDYFYQNPTKIDIEYMDSIYHGADNTHDKYTPLFTEKIKAKNFFRPHKQPKWITKKQLIKLAIFVPISIRIDGIKNIELNILPYIPRLFCISINIFEYSTLKFGIGGFNKL